MLSQIVSADTKRRMGRAAFGQSPQKLDKER